MTLKYIGLVELNTKSKPRSLRPKHKDLIEELSLVLLQLKFGDEFGVLKSYYA